MASNPEWPPIEQALNVAPLNSMPYVDPTATPSSELQRDPTKKTPEPALVFLPAEPTREVLDKIFAASKDGVVLSGSAAKGSIGPVVGKIDISESKEKYKFRVALPGVAQEEFSCDVTPDGEIKIAGDTTTGEPTVFKHGMTFVMQTQNLCPPGRFTISFKLPGPVQSQKLTCCFGFDGIFEGTVEKQLEN